MFKLAGRAVAVGNARKQLKETATELIGTNEEDSSELRRYLKVDQIFHAGIVALSVNSIIINFDSNFVFILAINERQSLRAQKLVTEHFLKIRRVIQERHTKSK